MNYNKFYDFLNDSVFGSKLPYAAIIEFNALDPWVYIHIGIDYMIDGLCTWDKDTWVIGMAQDLTPEEKCYTIAHEMIHIWQNENDLPVDHGRHFKQVCRQMIEEFNL